ncbi:hypothetical protein REB14_03915 [Chryseobacterium sp. ES2]|uniref:Lipoprotein n=1 Tax=Chryseobacterium metallicongregator TaxID=3073042 RepID=A0ABU1E0L7_9FLAO|nr:hypothetical protein [Chryseobacterium sp. ES2]MDR4951333.1 hypothetical protein [Chryseobacterium sp. ES2]
MMKPFLILLILSFHVFWSCKENSTQNKESSTSIKKENIIYTEISFDKQEFVLYQNVTQNESADFFPALYVTKLDEEPKTFCLTSTTEESFTDKIIINDKKIILRENYWDPNEERRKNDRLKRI